MNWQSPSSAPKDTSYIATIDIEGRLEVRTYEPSRGHWRVWSIPGCGERYADTMIGVVGWARWSEIWEHMRKTTDIPAR